MACGNCCDLLALTVDNISFFPHAKIGTKKKMYCGSHWQMYYNPHQPESINGVPSSPATCLIASCTTTITKMKSVTKPTSRLATPLQYSIPTLLELVWYAHHYCSWSIRHELRHKHLVGTWGTSALFGGRVSTARTLQG